MLTGGHFCRQSLEKITKRNKYFIVQQDKFLTRKILGLWTLIWP